MAAPICSCCGQTLKARKVVAPVVTETAQMSDTALYAYYKATAPFEDCRFYLANAQMSDALRTQFEALAETGNQAHIKRSLPALQAEWRREANARERQARIAAGDVLVSGYWVSPTDAQFDLEVAS